MSVDKPQMDPLLNYFQSRIDGMGQKLDLISTMAVTAEGDTGAASHAVKYASDLADKGEQDVRDAAKKDATAVSVATGALNNVLSANGVMTQDYKKAVDAAANANQALTAETLQMTELKAVNDCLSGLTGGVSGWSGI